MFGLGLHGCANPRLYHLGIYTTNDGGQMPIEQYRHLVSSPFELVKASVVMDISSVKISIPLNSSVVVPLPRGAAHAALGNRSGSR